MQHKCHWMHLFHFIINFHVAIYVFFCLTGTKKPSTSHIEKSATEAGWVVGLCWRISSAQDAQCDVAPRGCTSITPREGSFRLGEMGVPVSSTHTFCPSEEWIMWFFIWDFSGILKCCFFFFFFISRWFSLLGIVAASLTSAWRHHTSAVGFVLLTQSCTKQDSQWELVMLGISWDVLSTFQYWALNNGLELKQHIKFHSCPHNQVGERSWYIHRCLNTSKAPFICMEKQQNVV